MKDKYDGLIFHNTSKPEVLFKLKLNNEKYITYNMKNEIILVGVYQSVVDVWLNERGYAPLKWANGHTICKKCNSLNS